MIVTNYVLKPGWESLELGAELLSTLLRLRGRDFKAQFFCFFVDLTNLSSNLVVFLEVVEDSASRLIGFDILEINKERFCVIFEDSISFLFLYFLGAIQNRFLNNLTLTATFFSF